MIGIAGAIDNILNAGGNMMWIADAESTAAISNAGGLGTLCF